MIPTIASSLCARTVKRSAILSLSASSFGARNVIWPAIFAEILYFHANVAGKKATWPTIAGSFGARSVRWLDIPLEKRACNAICVGKVAIC
jgi:hypothetical protein